MVDDLTDLIPEFDLITDTSLRAKCLKTWEAAIGQGGWRVEDLTRMAHTLLLKDVPTNFVEHTRAVVLTCVGVADIYAEIYGDRNPLDRDHLIAGALLHDVGKLVEYAWVDGKTVQSDYGRHLRHPFSGVILAAQQGIPADVLHMIATHAKEGDLVQRSREATVIHHADFTSFETLR
jgi:putative nucleotidyltransferase with HDIG domain